MLINGFCMVDFIVSPKLVIKFRVQERFFRQLEIAGAQAAIQDSMVQYMADVA